MPGHWGYRSPERKQMRWAFDLPVADKDEERESKFSNGTATFHCASVHRKVEGSIDIIGIKGVKSFIAYHGH